MRSSPRYPAVALFAVLVASLASSRGAGAQEPAHPTSQAESQARELYAQGAAHMERGEFDAAIVAYRKAFELSAAPGFLFNLARAFEAKGDCASARSYYHAYQKADPQGATRYGVDEVLTTLTNCPSSPAPKPVIANATPAPAPAPLVHPDHGPSPRRERVRTFPWLTYTLGVSGVAFLATGAVMSYYASSVESEVGELMQGQGARWSSSHEEREQRAQLFDTLAPYAYGLGGMALITGGVLWYRSLPAHDSARLTALCPIPGGWMASVMGRF
jgi:tetratricopeptide (TPR) repeat protein